MDIFTNKYNNLVLQYYEIVSVKKVVIGISLDLYVGLSAFFKFGVRLQ